MMARMVSARMIMVVMVNMRSIVSRMMLMAVAMPVMGVRVCSSRMLVHVLHINEQAQKQQETEESRRPLTEQTNPLPGPKCPAPVPG